MIAEKKQSGAKPTKMPNEGKTTTRNSNIDLLRVGRFRSLAMGLFTIAGIAVSLEVFCQLYALSIYATWRRTMRDPAHYYQKSQNPKLAYELKRDINLVKDGRRLQINHFGFRDDSNDLAKEKIRIGILGDSVVFGVGLSQEETLTSNLQIQLDPDVKRAKVLNLGLPGAGLRELLAQLENAFEIYHPNKIVYVLNPNDFSVRDTVFEGADNGLYRMYMHLPFLKTRWFVNKAIYRFYKGGAIEPTAAWYSWLYRANRDELLPMIKNMATKSKHVGASFSVVLLPVRSLYDVDDFTVSKIYGDIAQYLVRNSIAYLDPTSTFADDPTELIDSTDHLTAQGSARMATVLEEYVLTNRERNDVVSGFGGRLSQTPQL